jgi:hypothetical protein
MTKEEREQRWAEAMRAERRGDAVAYERMLKEAANALRRSLAPRLVRVGLGAHEAEDLVQEILIHRPAPQAEYLGSGTLVPAMVAHDHSLQAHRLHAPPPT